MFHHFKPTFITMRVVEDLDKNSQYDENDTQLKRRSNAQHTDNFLVTVGEVTG
jgi:hypothetical protein